MNNINRPKFIYGIDDIAHEVTRISGGYYFSPDTRRFFNARASKACIAPDGNIYVLHSTSKPQWNIPRLYSVSVFSKDENSPFNLCKDVSSKSARSTFDRVCSMGCEY